LSNKPSLVDTAKPAEPLQPQAALSFEAIGTHWLIELYEPITKPHLAQLRAAILTRIDQFDALYSRFRADSLVTKLSQTSGSYEFPPDVLPLLAFYRQLYDVTEGKVTPLIGQLLADAGYDATYSLTPKPLQPVPSWDEALSVAGQQITARQPVLLDFGAAGKGYLVDIIGELIETRNIAAYCVDAGGDIRFRHPTTALTVGLEHPDDPSLVIGTVALRNQSICASAGNRRAWRGYHHIMDPTLLTSMNAVKASWVVAASTMQADGLATALFFTPAARLKTFQPFEYAVMEPDNAVSFSKFFAGRLF
jgi:thiamine biosynthesis lipoprotein